MTALQVVSSTQPLWWIYFSFLCMLYCHACWSVCAVTVLEQIHLWFYSVPWLNCRKHFSLETCPHRHSIKQILWQLKDCMSPSTKTSILLSAKTFSSSPDRSPENKVIWRKTGKITDLLPNKEVQANLRFHVLTSTFNQTHNFYTPNIL